ncbi:hypothetical protein, partial [Oribacterium parvum]|uniref:hypothetical protein n=1 Tax=Oribacterium parvum TaxID=1501329 RepID=UPI0023561E54
GRGNSARYLPVEPAELNQKRGRDCALFSCCIRVACVTNYGGFSSAAADISPQRGTEKARI